MPISECLQRQQEELQKVLRPGPRLLLLFVPRLGASKKKKHPPVAGSTLDRGNPMTSVFFLGGVKLKRLFLEGQKKELIEVERSDKGQGCRFFPCERGYAGEQNS